MDVLPGSTCKVFVNVMVAGGPVEPDGDTVSGVLSSHPDAVPEILKTGTGQYTLTFFGLCPALEDGNSLECAVSGAIGGDAWTPFAIPLVVVADGSLAGAAARPRVVQAGTERIEEHSLKDQIEFDRYQKQQQAQAATPGAIPVLRWRQTHGRP